VRIDNASQHGGMGGHVGIWRDERRSRSSSPGHLRIAVLAAAESIGSDIQ
jgi:hypothetical protein